MKGGNADAEDAVDEYYPEYSSTTGINGVSNSSEVIKTTYTTLSGQNINNAGHGVYIMVKHFADGTKQAVKCVK